MKPKCILSKLPLLVLLFLTTAACAQNYTMSLLGFAPFSNSINGMNGINQNGDVVGFDSTINGAFVDRAGVVSSLGLTSGVGVAINSNGFIAVRSWGADLHSYLYNPGRLLPGVSRFSDLGTLGGSGGLNNTGQTIALDMNDSRTIVGSSTVPSTGSQMWHAFSWSAGHMTDLGGLPGAPFSNANAINNLGQIVGDSFRADGYDRAIQLVNGVMTDMDPANPNYDSSAVAINNNGQIVVVTDLAWRLVNFGYTGWRFVAYRGPIYYTQIYSNGVFTTISPGATSGMYGNSINNSGNVVGYSIFPDGTSHAFLYYFGTAHDLNDVVINLNGWRLAYATRINDAGEIVCWAYNATLEQWQTAVLTPIYD